MLKVNINSVSINNNNNGKPLLRSVNFELLKGKIYTILGENGTGKSTLIKALTSLLNERLYSVKGTVYLEDIEISTCSPEELRLLRLNNIRYVFQDTVNSFDPLRTFDYYFSNSNSKQDKIDQLLDYFLLPSYKKLSVLYPYEVSGGMAQRISTVLTFLSNSEFIILDEPTTGIDYAISNLLLLKLKEYKEKQDGTVLIVTHNMNFAKKVSDEAAVLSGGTLSQFRTAPEFFSHLDIELMNFASVTKGEM
jgi:ABC-type glutathione transport system ATPase component